MKNLFRWLKGLFVEEKKEYPPPYVIVSQKSIIEGKTDKPSLNIVPLQEAKEKVDSKIESTLEEKPKKKRGRPKKSSTPDTKQN